jgi:hypothetical protein
MRFSRCPSTVVLKSKISSATHGGAIALSQASATAVSNRQSIWSNVACRLRVKDGPILSQARSRSKGPLSDQVADAPNSRGQCRSWVESSRSAATCPNGRFGTRSTPSGVLQQCNTRYCDGEQPCHPLRNTATVQHSIRQPIRPALAAASTFPASDRRGRFARADLYGSLD